MNIVDLIIILIVITGILIGYKRGFTKELVCFCKFAFSLIIAFLFKNPLSKLMYENLPFFKFGGFFKGISALNIILYEFIAFLLVLLIIMIVFRILMVVTTIFEKILNATIILGIPSKILGMILGAIHYFLIIFVTLFIISLPMLNTKKLIENSLLSKPILKHTPILSDAVDDTVKVIDEFNSLIEKYDSSVSTNEFNLETIDLLLKYDIITIDSINILTSKGKLKIKGLDKIIDKYKEA